MVFPGEVETQHEVFRYQLELCDEAGQVIREVSMQPHDFRASVYATCFDGLRRGICAHYTPDLEAASVEPLFAASNSQSPHAVGFRVSVATDIEREHHLEFSLAYFGSRASCIRAELVRGQQISASSQLRYHLSAYLDDPPSRRDCSFPLCLESPTFHVPIESRRRADFGDTDAWDQPKDEADEGPPVLITHTILEEALEESRRAPDREIGGVLLGHLCRDPDTREIFLHLSGLVSGEETVHSSESSVTFTPETWHRAREMISLRGAGEVMVGWYHSHPFRLCQECPLPALPECVNKILFYSQDDIHLMETTFDQPYMVGLLVAVDERLERSLGHLPVRLFGWKKGEIHARGCEVLDA